MKLTQICSQPVYIITAIKVCNNVSVKFIRTDWISGHPNGIQMPVRDIGDNELSVFPSSGHFHSKEGIVCAYQVSKIVPEGRRSKTKVVRLKPFPPRGFVVEEDWAPVLLNSFHMHQWEWNNIDLRDWSPVSGMA
ncbi:hypothetical protein BO71DRAFT_400786 [Aspergillus ellipticus CBS 707.79]|uniref:Uncharacterized protein n=1 Tax=Aspergillus ellipticus CBS 707.79 TaxID=1448320 RepID=A0A319D4C4_9EURO|nr:hypothetical protein BO71DRAFT_400786 [Aspergillus ellipticus CBS 707.79]